MLRSDLHRAAGCALAACLLACSSKTENKDGAPPSPSATAARTASFTIVLPHSIPTGTPVHFDKEKLTEVTARGDYHVVVATLPESAGVKEGTDKLTIRPVSPCGDVDLPLAVRKDVAPKDAPKLTDPNVVSYKLADGAWDRVDVYVHASEGSPSKVRIGKLALTGNAAGTPYVLFGRTCPEANDVFVDDKKVGELPPPADKGKAAYYLVSLDAKQTYCMSRNEYGVGLAHGAEKAETYEGKQVYRMLGPVDFWLQPPAEKVENKDGMASHPIRYDLQLGACKKK